MGLTKDERRKVREDQLEKFCAKYGLDKSKAVIGGGYRKDVIALEGEVYILPFSEQSAAFVEREHAFFRVYHGRVGVEIPRFIRSFRDSEFCPHDIGVISTVQGDMYPVMESMDWPRTRSVLLSLADAAAGWHSVEPDAELFRRHGSTFAPLSGLAHMGRWLSWLLNPGTERETVEWLHALLLDAAKSAGVDTAFLERPGTKAAWHSALAEFARLEPVVLHGDMHDGQIVLKRGEPVVAGVIDWDNFCLGNPLVDFNTCKWFPDRMWTFRAEFHPMRVEMWRRYLDRRGLKGFRPGGLSLFCLMTEAVRVVCEKDRPRIWMTKGPYREALAEYLGYLETATAGFAE